MLKPLSTAFIASFIALAWPAPVVAHGGGLNSEGCHNNRQTGGYHCHRAGKARAKPKRVAAKPRPQRAASGVYYARCAEAYAAGTAPLYSGDPGYRPGLDGDSDGVACENPPGGRASMARTSGGTPSSGKRSARSSAKVVPIPVPVPSAQSAGDMPWQPVGLLSAAAPPTARVAEGFAVVTDGDSLTIGGERIRLFGVDAFEAEQTCGNGLRCGAKATEYLYELVGYRSVRCVQRDTDSYGRMVAVCYYEGQDINAAMVRSGWALAYRDYSQDYVADEEKAKRGKVGAHVGTFDTPHDFRRGIGSATAVAQRDTPNAGACIIKGNISAKGEKIYHLPGQSGYQKVKPEAMFCTIQEAEKAGFRARKR